MYQIQNCNIFKSLNIINQYYLSLRTLALDNLTLTTLDLQYTSNVS